MILEDAGHFVWDDDPERCAKEVVSFLEHDAWARFTIDLGHAAY